MSDSFLLFFDPSGFPHISDPDRIPNSCPAADEAQLLLGQLRKRGYPYLHGQLDQLPDGRLVVTWLFDLSTPQGRLLRSILQEAMQGIEPPSLAVLDKLLASK